MNEILLGEGLNDLKFGMTQDEVKAILNEPTEVETDSEEGIDVVTMHYDNEELSLVFDGSLDLKLVSIASSNDALVLKERKIIGLAEGDLISSLDSMGFDDVSDEHFEADSDSENMYTSDEFGINFFIDNGEVSEVIWYPDFNEEGDVIWP
mgnify:CR=1 FL=1